MIQENKHKFNLPIVALNIDNEFVFRTLIDSGSSINILSQVAYDLIKDSQFVKVIKHLTNSHCIAANNTQIPLRELVAIEFSICNISYVDQFYVTDKVSPSFDFILGTEFLGKHDHCLGFKDFGRFFNLNDVCVPLLESNVNASTFHGIKMVKMQHPEFRVKVTNLEKFNLRPQMCAFIDMFTAINNSHICNAYVDALDHELGFIVPPQLIKLNGNHAKIMVMNNYDYEVVIPAKLILITTCWCAKLAFSDNFKETIDQCDRTQDIALSNARAAFNNKSVIKTSIKRNAYPVKRDDCSICRLKDVKRNACKDRVNEIINSNSTIKEKRPCMRDFVSSTKICTLCKDCEKTMHDNAFTCSKCTCKLARGIGARLDFTGNQCLVEFLKDPSKNIPHKIKHCNSANLSNIENYDENCNMGNCKVNKYEIGKVCKMQHRRYCRFKGSNSNKCNMKYCNENEHEKENDCKLQHKRNCKFYRGPEHEENCKKYSNPLKESYAIVASKENEVVSTVNTVPICKSRNKNIVENSKRYCSSGITSRNKAKSSTKLGQSGQVRTIQDNTYENKKFTEDEGNILARKAQDILEVLNEDLVKHDESNLWEVKAENLPKGQPKPEPERKNIIRDYISKHDLNELDKRTLTNLCLEFSKLFYVQGDKIGLVKNMICKIETKAHAEPLFTKQFRLSLHDENIIHEKVQELLRNDIIKRGSSPYNSPVFLVKQHGKGRDAYRMVIDYRRINELVLTSRYKLPQIDDMLTKLRNNSIFTSLDIKNAFNSLGIDEESQPLLAFSTNNASYLFKTLIFGLSSGPSIYSNLLHEILHEFIDSGEIIIFIDDILVFSKDKDAHFKLLSKIFKRLDEFNIKLKLAKCTFMQNSIQFLGHEISQDGIRPLVEKVQAIKDLPSPKTRKELMSVLGLINYYLKFIPNLSLYSSKLTELLKKDRKYVWTEEQENALNIIKHLISENTVLSYPDPNKEYFLVTDASASACGSYLGQKNNLGEIKPIGFHSRVFSETQSRYSAIEREMLAIVIALEHFHPFISASKINIMTDHKPLLGVINATNSKRLEKMKVKILDLNLTFTYIPGKENVLADLLSRAVPTYQNAKAFEKELFSKRLEKLKESLPLNNCIIDCNINAISHPIVDYSLESVNVLTRAQLAKQSQSPIRTTDNVQDVLNDADVLINNSISLEEIKNAQANDNLCIQLNSFLSGENFSDISVAYFQKFVKIDGILCFTSEIDGEIKYRYFLPNKELQQKAIYNAHTSHLNNHIGYSRCLKNLTETVYWQNMGGDLYDFISSCEHCIIYKKLNNIHKATGTLKPSTAPNQALFLDLIGPLNHSGCFHYILSIFDSFSHYLWLYPIKAATSEEVIKSFFGSHIYLYDIPHSISLDNATCFMSHTFTKLAEVYAIAINFICPRSPWENSVEKCHKDIKNHLRTLLKGSENLKWHEFLPTICRIHNTNYVTPLKTTPSTLYFGRHPRNTIINDITFPNDSFPPLLATHLYNVQKLYENASKHKGLYQEKINLHKKQLKRNIKIGDKVYVKKPLEPGRSAALQNIMHGPYTVVKTHGKYAFDYLDHSNKLRRCHINNCKILHMDST